MELAVYGMLWGRALGTLRTVHCNKQTQLGLDPFCMVSFTRELALETRFPGESDGRHVRCNREVHAIDPPHC